MLKEHDTPKEPARIKAERKWGNADVRERIKAERQVPKLVDPSWKPGIAETISNDDKLSGPVNRLESRFKKEIRAMLESHVDRNLAIYAASIERRRIKLLKEKLRRLQLAQQTQGGSNV
jgi:hypothetical protein